MLNGSEMWHRRWLRSKGGNLKVKEVEHNGRTWHKSGGGGTNVDEGAQKWGMQNKGREFKTKVE